MLINPRLASKIMKIAVNKIIRCEHKKTDFIELLKEINAYLSNEGLNSIYFAVKNAIQLPAKKKQKCK